jgi:hypothetical protein
MTWPYPHRSIKNLSFLAQTIHPKARHHVCCAFCIFFRGMTNFGQERVCCYKIKHSDGRESAFSDWRIPNLGQERVCRYRIEHSVGRESACSDWSIPSPGQEWSCCDWIEHSVGRDSTCSDRSIPSPGQERSCRDWIEHSDGCDSTCSNWSIPNPGQDWSCRYWIKHSVGRQSAFSDWRIPNLGQDWSCSDQKLVFPFSERSIFWMLSLFLHINDKFVHKCGHSGINIWHFCSGRVNFGTVPVLAQRLQIVGCRQ